VPHISFIFLRRDPSLVLLEQSFLALFLQLVLTQRGQCLNADSFENLVGEVVKGGDPERPREIGDFYGEDELFGEVLVEGSAVCALGVGICLFSAFGVVAGVVVPLALEIDEADPELEL
jgi:hypothetical protein